MDTKKKTRPADPRKRSRSEAQPKSASPRRAESSRKGQTAAKRNAQTRRPAQQTARRPEQSARRQEQQSRRPRERAAEAEAELHRQQENVTSDAPEMVFRMDGTEIRKKHEQVPQDPAEAKRTQQRKRSAQRTQERRKQASRRSNAPKVVYTDPRPFNLHRLILQLIAVLAVVLAISLGLSVFFKVENVVVYGNNAYTPWTIQEASGIEGGEKLLTFGNIRACGKIKAALPYVDTVRIGIKLPNTVNIYITEFDVVYAIQDQNSAWWLMTSDGRVVEQTDSGTAGSYTKVVGVQLSSPVSGEQAMAYEEPVFEDSTEPNEETAALLETTPPVTVTANDRLNAALRILDALELNDMVGKIASIDVTTLNNIELWYGNQYQVRLGDINDLNHDVDYKIACMAQSIAQLSDYQTGILDVSFITWVDKVGYTPFG